MFKKLSLLTKLLVCFSLVALCMIFVGFAAYISGQKTVSEYQKIALKNLPTSMIAATLRGTAKDVRAMVFRIGFAENTDEQLTAITEKIAELTEQYKDSTREYTAFPFVEGEKELFEAAQAKWNLWLTVVNKASAQRMKKTTEVSAAYIEFINGELRDTANDYFDAINELVLFHQTQARLARLNAEKTADIGTYTSIGLILLGTFLALAIGIIFGRDLAHSLMTVILRVDQSSRQVGESSQHLATASQLLSSGATDGASSLEETVASIEELTGMVKLNADHAKQAANLSLESRQSAEDGAAEVHKLIRAMDEVSKSSKKIEEIISVIDDIAFQTNLLALNAAVEAARAGEQGKGFAVVADAVRSLAQRSAVAAKDINTLIKDSGAQTEYATQVANSSGDVLQKIVASVSQVSHLVGEIANASREQSGGLEQISIAVNQLDRGTQKTAASAQQTADAAEEMSSQAAVLQNLMRDLTQIVEGANQKPLQTNDDSMSSNLNEDDNSIAEI